MSPIFSFNIDLTSSVNAPKIQLAITTWEDNTLQALTTYKSLQFMNNFPVNWWRLKVERLDSWGNKTIYQWLSPYVGHYFGNALVLGHYYTQNWKYIMTTPLLGFEFWTTTLYLCDERSFHLPYHNAFWGFSLWSLILLG
jgi:hypothetical protein